MSLISFFQLVAIILTCLSTRYFFSSARVRIPDAPQKGELISADYPHALSKSLREMAEFNKKACHFLTWALATQASIWFVGIWP